MTGNVSDSFSVERSFGGMNWRPRLEDGRESLMLAQRLELPELLARVLAG
ncbi:MAG: hypothetical protein HN565_05830, partial [Rhodospirillales bacterium]|nr:hypothetical protein [Rhodospirillales bacterium]